MKAAAKKAPHEAYHRLRRAPAIAGVAGSPRLESDHPSHRPQRQVVHVLASAPEYRRTGPRGPIDAAAETQPQVVGDRSPWGRRYRQRGVPLRGAHTLAATLIQLGISRSREFLADETGANISGDPEALARALVKLEQASALVPVEAVPATASLFIVNPFGGMQTVSKWFSTHPQTHERVERLLAMARSRRRAA